MKVSETLTDFNRVLKSFNQEVWLLLENFYIALNSEQVLGDKDAFMLSAFQRLGSYVSEVRYNVYHKHRMK